jgi:hypothetical protein
VTALGSGLLAGVVAYRRRSTRRLERVELYGADGSMVSLDGDAPDSERLLGLAHDLLALTR